MRRTMRLSRRTQAKITDLEAFEEFAHQHDGKTQAQMAQLWGEPISPRTISLLMFV